MFIISVGEIQYVVSQEAFNRIIDILLLYFSSANKEISEEDIVQKIEELGGKGDKIMTILKKAKRRIRRNKRRNVDLIMMGVIVY